MTNDATRDAKLALRLHDAYDAMGPSPEVQSRVLAALKEADASKARVSVRRSPWLVVLPLAACLALVAVVMSISWPSPSANVDEIKVAQADKDDGSYDAATSASESAAAQESYVADEDYEANDAFASSDAMANDEEPMATPLPVQEYPVVALPTGETLRVSETPAKDVSDEDAVDARASNEDGTLEMPCEVLRIDDGYAVRYEGDDTWYVAQAT